MSDKYGKSVDIEQINVTGQDLSGSTLSPLDLNTIQQSYASTFPMDLDYMDMLEKAADEEEFRMLGVTDAPPLGQRQIEAAQDYIDDLSRYISSANSENKQALDDAKQKLVELNVSREQIESVTNYRFPEGIDTSKGIEGVFGPTIGGAVKQGYENLIDLYGTGALQALGSVIELAGGDKDLALGGTKVGVNPIGPGVSYIFGDDGKVRTTSLGQTKTGTPVVLTGPIGAAGAIGGDILRGDIDIFGIPGAVVGAVGGPAGVVQTAANAGVLGLGEKDKDTEDIFLDEEAILASILNDDDPNKKNKTTDQVTVDDAGAGTDADDAEIQVAGLESKDRADANIQVAALDSKKQADADIQVDALGALNLGGEFVLSDLPGGGSIRTGGEFVLSDLPGGGSIRTGEINPYEYETSTPTIKTGETPVIRTGDVGGGGGGGGGGFGTPTGGVETVSVEPGPLVDIPGFYDISSMSIIPDYIDELVERERRRQTRGAAEGGHVKKFSNGGSPGDFESLAPIYGGAPSSTGVRGKLSQFVGDNAGALLASAVGGLFGLLDKDEQQPSGYQGGIPDYTAQRSLLPGAFDQTGRRPGSMGRRYFTDVQYVPTGEGAVMQGVGLPAVAPAADTSTELDTEALASLVAAPVGTAPAAITFGTPTGDAQKPYGYGTEDIFPYFEQGLTPADIIGADSRFSSVKPGTMAYNSLMQDYEYWQNNVAGTTPAGTTPAGTTPTPNAYNTFVSSFMGRQLTPEDATALANSGYSIDQLASSFGTDPNELRQFVNYHTNGFMTTADGKVGPIGMKNLLINQLGYAQNADGTLTDPTNGRIYGFIDGAWRPTGTNANTTTTTTTAAGTAAGTADAAGTAADTAQTAQTATDFLLDLGYGQAMTGQEAANKLASDLNTMAESEFGVDTLLDTLGIDTAEEKANVAKLTPNPFLKLDIAGGESNVLPEGVGGMDVLSPAEAALQQDLISKQATSLAQAGGDPFQQAIYSSLSSDTAGLRDSLPYYAGVVGDVLRSGGDTLAGTAEKFDLTVPEAAEELMLTGAMTPDEVAGLVNTPKLTKDGQPATTGDPALDMMIALIEGGTTTLEEGASIYGIPADQAEAVYEDVIKNRLQPIQAAAQGGMMQGQGYAAGGMGSLDGMGQGYYLGGPTDGMADLVPATIDGNQPAALSDGEFVIPADVVSHLGNGNSEAGAQQLYSMMDRVRTERTGTTKQGPEINPTQMMPA
jgi:hypothetical protein